MPFRRFEAQILPSSSPYSSALPLGAEFDVVGIFKTVVSASELVFAFWDGGRNDEMSRLRFVGPLLLVIAGKGTKGMKQGQGFRKSRFLHKISKERENCAFGLWFEPFGGADAETPPLLINAAGVGLPPCKHAQRSAGVC